MALLARPVIYPFSLLLGALLVAGAGLLHPRLGGDGAAQLDLIARADPWRVIHWTILFAFPVSLVGLIGVVGRHVNTPGESATRAGLIVGTFAYACWAIVVTFMAAAAPALAQAYVRGEPGLAATQAVFVYEMLHPFGLAALRLAAFSLGLATSLYGWGLLNGKVVPRWLGWLGVGGGGVAVLATLAVGEGSVLVSVAFVPSIVWQVLTALLSLKARPA